MAAQTPETAPDQVAELEKQIVRLERRLNRERKARLEAESIAEEGMRKLFDTNTDLDRRISERTQELEAATALAQASSAAKGALIGALSHEVRTPMNGVLGMLELLRDSSVGDQQAEWLDTASSSARRMNRLFARMFELFELNGRDLSDEFESVVIDELLSDYSAFWAPKLMRRGKLLVVESFLDPGTTINTARRPCRRVLDELLSNALEHASPGSVRLEVEGKANSVRLSVTDSGPGITADRLVSLLVPFDMRTTDGWPENGGLGIGFSLAQRAAEAIGGRLLVESDGASTAATLELLDSPS